MVINILLMLHKLWSLRCNQRHKRWKCNSKVVDGLFKTSKPRNAVDLNNNFSSDTVDTSTLTL